MCIRDSPYAASKASSDHFVMSYHNTYGLPVLITNCSNNYGPRQHREKLIPKTINNILEGKKIVFDSPKDALDIGIATVYQDLALVSLMSVTRNFFMGREPMKGPPFFKTFDIEKANKIAAERMGQIGIDVRDPSQAVGTMSGGERQCLAISRAIYFGAKVLILDEPTSALGVHQASVVLKYIVKAASQGLAVILITHNVHHAYPVGNSFTVLNRGKSLGTYEKKDITREKLLSMMAGGEELNKLEVELEEMNRLSSQ